jgi:peroxidase
MCVKCEADCSFPSCWAGNCLDLANKGIGTICEGAFLGLPQLQTLLLDDNEIQAIPEGAFLGLPQLQELSLGGTGIQAIPETAFQALPLLQTLWLACRRAS